MQVFDAYLVRIDFADSNLPPHYLVRHSDIATTTTSGITEATLYTSDAAAEHARALRDESQKAGNLTQCVSIYPLETALRLAMGGAA